MAILINDTAPRSQYTATSGQTVFSVPFEFFANSDLKVYKNSTLLTLTTDYTVTGAGVTGGGSLTLVTGATAGDIVTIVRDVPVARTSDFPTSGPFNIEALNTDLDRLTAMVQQQETLDTRSLRLDQFDTPNTLNVLPTKTSRVGRVLQFNSSTGQPEAGPTTSEVANAQTYATNAATSASNAASSASAASTSASNASTSATNAASSASAASTSASNASSSASAASTSASNASTSASAASTSATAAAGSASTATTQASNASSSASAAATSASNASTSASNAASSASAASSSASAASASQIAAAASAAAAAASYDSFDDRYLGVKASDPTLDNDGNALVAGALYYNSTTATMKVYDGANWITATSAGNVSLLNYRYVATTGQTTFSGADANAATLSYAPNNIIVSRNGAVLDPTDYTATSGTSVILVNAATAGDNINIIAFKSFTTADMVPASTGGTFNGGVNVTGNLGVGTTSPAQKLDVKGIMQLTNSATPANTSYLYDGGGLLLSSNNSNPMYFYTGASERMRIASSGNVGIGTSSPSADTTYKWLNIVGPTTSGGGIVQLNNSDSSVGVNMFCNNLAGYVGTSTAHPLLFRINSSEAARIDTSGNLLLNTTTAWSRFAVQHDGATQFGITTVNPDTSGVGQTSIAFVRNGSYVGTINTTSSATSYNTSSDYRLKNSAAPMTTGLATIAALKPVTYKWNVDDSDGEGFIAHELQSVIPHAVTGEKDAVDANGKPIHQGVDYSKIVVHLVAAIQELKAQNDELKARVAALEGATQ